MPDVIEGPDLPPALGPYSQAVRAGGLLFVAGQPGLDPATGRVPGDDFVAEARQAFTNLTAVLRASGCRLDQVVKTTVFMSDAGNFGAMNELFREFFPTKPPVRATPIVGLPRGLRISIEAVAEVNEPGG